MNRLRKVIGNTVVSLLGQGVTWISTLVLTIAYGRFLGDVKFGELYFAITFVALVGFPIESGFNQQLTRDVAQEPAKALRYVSNILCLKVLLWLVLYGSILLLSVLLGYPVEVRSLVAICGVTLLSGSIANIMSALHYAFERVVYPVVGTILEKGLSALIGVILLRHGASVQTMALVLLASSCASMLWQTTWVVRLVGIPRFIDVRLAWDLLRKSIPFLIYGVLGVIYYRIDTIMLSLVASAAVVGWYGAGYRIFDTLVFLPSLVISAIMYPVFSKLSVHSQSELKVAVEKSLNFLLFCGVPIAAGLIVAAPNLVGFLYHQADFVNAAPVMQYLAPGLLFLYINSVLTSTIISTGGERKITIMAGVALVFNVGLNVILIPRYLHVGAAIVTSLTELLLTIFSLLFIPRSLWPSASLKVAAKALLASVIMGVVIWLMRSYSLLAILPVAMIVYFSVAMLLGTIPREDIRALYTSVRHKAARTPSVSNDVVEIASLEDIHLTDEEMQPELEMESLMLMGHQMSNPSLPAIKYDMPLAEVPFSHALSDEEITARRRTVILLTDSQKIHTINSMRLPETPSPLLFEEDEGDEEPTLPRSAAIRSPIEMLETPETIETRQTVSSDGVQAN